MKALINIVFLYVLMFGAMSSTFSQNVRYGLEFYSFEMVQEKRTSLNLSPVKAFSFSNGFTLSADIFFQPAPEYNFGYIFRIIGQNNQHIDFLSTLQELNVIDSKDEVLATCRLSEVSNNFSSFFSFQISLDIKKNILNITIGDKLFAPQVSFLDDFKEVNIIFGRCDHPLFQTNDVPRMIIKDIRIGNSDGNAIYHWKMSKHVNDGVYDELKEQFAKAENPKWLLDKHTFWNKRISFNTSKNPQITYNSDKNIIVITDRRRFFTYNTNTNRLNHHENASGFAHSNSSNQVIYNPSDSTYYSYCFLKLEGRAISPYDFATKSWANNQIWEYNSEYWHHNRFVSKKENSLYLFGGYGQHQYKNYVNKYSFETKKWERLHYKNKELSPTPRYLSGLGAVNENTILLFGGYGSQSGLQSLSPKNYYDLYQINLPDLNTQKIWEMPLPVNQFVVANSMIVDTLNKCFYALCFPHNKYETSLFLAKFSLKNPEYKIVSDTILFYFNDILSYADLFQNRETNELYAITFSKQPTDSLTTVSIYSLSYPPMEPTSIFQSIDNNGSIFHIIGIVILALIFILAYLLFLRNKKKSSRNMQMEENQSTEFLEIKPLSDRNKKQAIFFFGGFQVNDKDSNDVTGKFSPLSKQLFLIVLLCSLKENNKGISSAKLDEILWPDKPHDSASNNRSVMLSKIRQIFENVGYLNIKNSNLKWTAELEDEVYFDYRKAIQLIRNMKININRTKETVMELLNIVSQGELLPDLQVEWVDVFKANFANELIDLLINVMAQKELAFSSSELIYLADALLIHDVLNDEALKLKCKTLVKMGKNGLAKATYNSFVKQYSILFETKYTYSFEQIIG
jgi:two-component SAPR family response regulator